MVIPKDTREFAKLFKIIIPYHEEFEYYINILARSEKYKNLPQLVDEFAAFEDWCTKHGYENVGNYKMGRAFKVIKNHILETDAYREFNGEIIGESLKGGNNRSRKDIRNELAGEWLRSIDLVNANFNVIKAFDEEGKMGDSWEDLCKKLYIHPTLAKSKSFRQVIFGHLNPKRNSKIQLSIISGYINLLLENSEIEESDIVFISNDEVILRADPIIKTKVGDFPTRESVFIFEKIGPKKENKLKTYENGVLELVGIPANRFYVHFRHCILNGTTEDRDLYFENDGHLAKWVI